MHPIHMPRRCALLVAIVALLTASVAAQIRVDTYPMRHLAGLDPSSLWPVESNDFAAGDVDGDGDIDLVIADNTSSSRGKANACMRGPLTHVEQLAPVRAVASQA